MIKTRDPEERTASVSGKSRDKARSRCISAKALEIVSQGARANPDGEHTVAVAESGGETTVYRIFRQRHMDGKSPLTEAGPVGPGRQGALQKHRRRTEGFRSVGRLGRREPPRRHHWTGDHRKGRDGVVQFMT